MDDLVKRSIVGICLTLVLSMGTISTAWSADWNKGWAAFEGGDYATALREWSPLAEQGDKWAQVNLGLMYANGLYVLQNYKTALKWWTLAAEQGPPERAIYDRDPMAMSQFNLGIMYNKGQGVLQDNVYAHMWFNIAASNGYKDAPKLRDIVANLMTPSQISEAQKLARECVRKNYKDC